MIHNTLSQPNASEAAYTAFVHRSEDTAAAAPQRYISDSYFASANTSGLLANAFVHRNEDTAAAPKHDLSDANSARANTSGLLATSYVDRNDDTAAVPQHQFIDAHTTSANKSALLATAIIRIQDKSGRFQPARVFFDNGSHATFITEACVHRLQLPRRSASVRVTGIGTSHGGDVKGKVNLLLLPKTSTNQFTINALILPKITNDIPSSRVKIGHWPHIKSLTLADPYFNKPGPIDILIGVGKWKSSYSMASLKVLQEHLWHLTPSLDGFCTAIQVRKLMKTS